MYRWTRNLHLYAGLVLSPFVLLFSFSVFFLNHRKIDPAANVTTRTCAGVPIPEGIETARGREAVNRARVIADGCGVTGEIGFLRYASAARRLTIPVARPGVDTVMDVDLVARTAVVTTRRTGAWEAVAYLHKTPGPHNADVRGNWRWTRIWRWLADGTVYSLLFVSASGVYLWLAVRAARRTGWVLLGAGALTLTLFLYAFVR